MKNPLESYIDKSIDSKLNEHVPILMESISFKTLKKYLTREQVAEYLQISLRSVTNYVKSGRLLPIRIGGRVLFDREDIDQMMEQLKGQGRIK